jgi:hypothetical protein
MPRFNLAVAATFIALSSSAAQQTDSAILKLRTDLRVRVSAHSVLSRQTIGRLASVTGDTILVVDSLGTTRRFAMTDVSGVDTSAGTRTRSLEGMAIGVVAGGLIGGAIAHASWKPCVAEEFLGCLLTPNDAGPKTIGGALVGMGVGVVIGKAVGMLFETEAWERVVSSRGPKPAFSGTKRGVQVQITF